MRVTLLFAKNLPFLSIDQLLRGAAFFNRLHYAQYVYIYLFSEKIFLIFLHFSHLVNFLSFLFMLHVSMINAYIAYCIFKLIIFI